VFIELVHVVPLGHLLGVPRKLSATAGKGS